MIWIILYVICIIICCGIILYDTNIDIDDAEIVPVAIGSIIWPIILVIAIIYGLGHCVRLLLTKIIRTK